MSWLKRLSAHGYVTAVLAVAVSTMIFLPGRDTFAKGQWALLYLLVILLVASAAGAGPAVVAAALAFFAWNFFFLPPYHTFAIQDPKDWLSLVAFLIVGVIVGIMAGRMREREARAVAREHEAVALNRLSAELVSHTSTATMAQAVVREAVEQLGATSATLFLADDGELKAYCSWPAHVVAGAEVTEAAERAFSRGQAQETDGVALDSAGLALPLQSPSTTFGALSVSPTAEGRAFTAAEIRLATSLAYLVSAFLERQELQAKATQAEAGREADRLKSGLLSSVSHELKTPLAALTATVSNLLESDVQWDAESVRDELRSIVSDVTRLNSSISALLDLSRLEAHTWEPRRELYDLTDIVAAGIDTLPAHQRGRVTLDIPDDLDPLLVDYSQWVRVVQNLLENAVLYAGVGTTGDRGRTSHASRRQGVGRGRRSGPRRRRTRGRVRQVLSRARSRCGSSVRHRPRPCHHAGDHARARRHGACRGRGPSRCAVRHHPAHGWNARGAAVSIPERPVHILVVDDEEQIRRALTSILRTRGYSLDVVANGQEALLHAIDTPPDLVVLDLALPDMSGIEVCRELRTWCTAPILILSVHSAEADKIKALDEGADDYLTKPFSAGELLARIRALLRRAAALTSPPPEITVGDLTVDIARRRVTRAGETSPSRPRSSTSSRFWPATPGWWSPRR